MHEHITTAARMLYQNLKADIENASTRIEHIRITSLAQEAANLLTEIEKLTAAAEDLNSATEDPAQI